MLDPVIDWFGMIRLTYGFCSPALARAIRARGGGPIDPKRDQHAAHEHNRQIVLMRTGPSGRLVPRVIGLDGFLAGARARRHDEILHRR